MKKFLLPGILAVFALFLPSRCRANPLDVPYQLLVDTVNFNQVVFSTATFPSLSSVVNNNVAQYAWCIDHVVVSAANTASNFTMYWATSTISNGTTDYVVVTSTAVPYDAQWPYRDPYCAPVGQPVLILKSSVVGSTITAQGYLWKGWNP